MQLTYRGATFESASLPTQGYCKPRALNWRYQISGETDGEAAVYATPLRKPRALNWRYQLT